MRKELTLEVIERWLKDPDCDVRAAAMNACQGKDVPLEVIERWLKECSSGFHFFCTRAEAENY